MDEDTLGTIVPVVIMVIFMLSSLFLRRRSMEKTEMGKVATLLAEINHNLKIIDNFSFTLKVKKFKTGTWNRHKTRLDFLDERLRATLAKTFDLADDFNQQIDSARKHQSSSYLASIEVDKLTDWLTKSQQGLGEWFNQNKDKELFPKKRGLLSR
jgi:hypothetical protein